MVQINSTVTELNKDVNTARFKPVVTNVINNTMEHPFLRIIYQKYSES